MSRKFHFAEFAWRSELGLHREGNEDSGLVTENLVAVADGMGGYAGGEIASQIVIETLSQQIALLNNSELDRDSRDDIFRNSLIDMDDAIRHATALRPELDGMGTTLTSLALFDDEISLLHIGDSRAYRIRGKQITQLSHDHTVVQELIDQGRLRSDEISDHPQRSFLTQALMGKGNVEPVLQTFPIQLGDIYLVCSDGLSGVVDEGKIVAAFSGDLQSAVNQLIDLTYKNGAPDNVTVIAVRISNVPQSQATTLLGAAS